MTIHLTIASICFAGKLTELRLALTGFGFVRVVASAPCWRSQRREIGHASGRLPIGKRQIIDRRDSAGRNHPVNQSF